MSEAQELALRRFFSAVGQPTRLKILGLLAIREQGAAELAARLDMKESQLAHHLRRLMQFGLVRRRSAAFTYTYELDRSAWAALQATINQAENPDGDRPTGTRPADPARVLADFVDGERLRRVPADPAELDVILTWLAGRFEPGRRYSGDEVLSRLERHFPRHTLLRRYLVDRRLLKRVGDVYWRSRPLVTPAPKEGE